MLPTREMFFQCSFHEVGNRHGDGTQQNHMTWLWGLLRSGAIKY